MSAIARLSSSRFSDPLPLQTVALRVPFISQFARGHGFEAGKTACLAASRAMLNAHARGRFTLSYDRIQVGYGEDGAGRMTSFRNTLQALAYLDRELEAGRSVVVGVSHADYAYGDTVTDHFVVVSGRLVSSNGTVQYTFLDPGTTDVALGGDQRQRNRFSIDARTHKLVREGTPGRGPITERRYEVSAVLKNAL